MVRSMVLQPASLVCTGFTVATGRAGLAFRAYMNIDDNSVGEMERNNARK